MVIWKYEAFKILAILNSIWNVLDLIIVRNNGLEIFAVVAHVHKKGTLKFLDAIIWNIDTHQNFISFIRIYFLWPIFQKWKGLPRNNFKVFILHFEAQVILLIVKLQYFEIFEGVVSTEVK